MLGREITQLHSENQKDHLIQTLRGMKENMDDGTELLELLQHDSPPFSADQRHQIAQCVSTIIRESNNNVILKKTTKTQQHMYIYNYIPESVWSILLDESKSIEDKMDAIAMFSVSYIGLMFPCPITRALMVATIVTSSRIKLSAEQEYARVKEFKRLFETKRKVSGRATYTCGVYPELPASFIVKHGNTYPPSDPAVECRIDSTRIREIAYAAPLRDTNKRLKSKSAPTDNANAVPIAHGDSASRDHIMFGMLRYMMGERPSSHDTMPKRGEIEILPGAHGIASRSHHVARPRDLPPIPHCIAGAATPPALTDADAKDKESADLDTMAHHVQSIIAAHKKSKGDKKAADTSTSSKKTKGKKATSVKPKSKAKRVKAAAIASADVHAADPDKDGDEREGSDSDDDGSETSEVPAPAMKVVKSKTPMKKKDACSGKLFRVTGKSDDAALHTPSPKHKDGSHGGDLATHCKPKPSFTPTKYNGGRIYHSKKRSAHGHFRCYVRSTDRVESTVSVLGTSQKDLDAAWSKCLKLIDSDPRPR